MNTNQGPQRINTSLEKLLGNLNAPSVDVLDIIFHSWSSIVGPDLAEHTNQHIHHSQRSQSNVDEGKYL